MNRFNRLTWRMPVLAGLSWLQVAFVIALPVPMSFLWVAPACLMTISLVWSSGALFRLAMIWSLLTLVSWAQLDYREQAASAIESGIHELEFEALGESRKSADGYLSWVLVSHLGPAGEVLPGLLKSSNSLVPSTHYRAILELSFSDSKAERAAFWATQVGEISVISPPSPADQTLIELRSRFLSSLKGVTPDATALVAGLAIGERSLLSSDLADRMKSLSLTHLVAVSGANLAIVAGGVYLLLAALGLKRSGRTAGAVVSIVSYVALVGPEPSVLRAGFMALMVILGQLLGRGNQSINALSLSVLALTHFDPFLALDFGFALSVAATAGLLIMAPPLYRMLKARLPMGLAAALAVAVSAQFFTLPILLMLENRIASYSILANLLAEPVVAPVTVLGIVAVLVAFANPWLAAPITWLASLGTAWIELVARNLSNLPAVTVAWLPQPYSSLVALVLLVATTVFVSSRRLIWLFVSITLLLGSLGWAGTNLVRYKTWPSTDWDVVTCDVSQGDALLLREGDSVMMIDTGREPMKLSECIAQTGVRQIDLLVLTHFDADHVAAVPDLLQEVKVTQVMVSGFPDDRPLPKLILSKLAENHVPVVKAQAGLRFAFGRGVVDILQPSLSAREAVDSNDASVVVSFTSPQYSLLALGDLGAEGQMRLLKNNMGHLWSLAESQLILKVSHHGSNDQAPELMRLLKPELALISVGADNNYGHPGKDVLALLKEVGATTLRTDVHGSIGLNFDTGPEIFVAGKL